MCDNNDATVNVDVNKVIKANYLQYGLSTTGFVGGIVLGVVRKSGFWGTCGWAILGGIAGGAIAAVINSTQNNFVK